MLDRLYDVIVVGAGPAGSYLACRLASLGHSVAVLEQESRLGINTCCTGIISTECFQSLGLDTNLILSAIKSAKFFSPSGKCLRLETENIQAYVVNRLLLDKALAAKAQSEGAQYFFSSPVVDIILDKDSIRAQTLSSGSGEVFSARAIVLANGFRPKLPHKLGLGRIKSFLVGAQTEVETKTIEELEVYFSHELAPGGFAWVVPISQTKAYVGLLATSRAKLYLEEFLNKLYCQGRIAGEGMPIEQKAVPMGTLRRSYGDRILVVGDAAGQVKPTTGGGIYFGHLGAQIATDVLHEGLTNNHLTAAQLSRYEKDWKATMGKELSRGYWARWAYMKLSDRQIEGIFNALDSSGLGEALLGSNNFSFDWHSGSVLAVLKLCSAYHLLRLKHIFLRKPTYG